MGEKRANNIPFVRNRNKSVKTRENIQSLFAVNGGGQGAIRSSVNTNIEEREPIVDFAITSHISIDSSFVGAHRGSRGQVKEKFNLSEIINSKYEDDML